MRRLIFSLFTWFCFAGSAWSAQLNFEIVARIDGAFLRGAGQTAKVPVGGILQGRMTYSYPPSRQVGGDYFYNTGLETLSISTDKGFSLSLDNRVASVYSSTNLDAFVVQSFIGEDPNGWNMFFDFTTTGWLGGKRELPTLFPNTFDSAYIYAYFLDEGDEIQAVEATIQSVTLVAESPALVPLPPTGAILGGVVILVAWSSGYRRRRRFRAQSGNYRK